MRNYNIFFYKELEAENIIDLTDEINRVPEDMQIVLYMSSMGGRVDMLDILQKVVDENNIELIWVGTNASAAFYFLVNNAHRVTLTNNSRGVWHLPYYSNMNVGLNLNTVYHLADSHEKAYYEESGIDYLSFSKDRLKIKGRLLKKLKRGGDILVSYKELQKIFVRSLVKPKK